MKAFNNFNRENNSEKKNIINNTNNNININTNSKYPPITSFENDESLIREVISCQNRKEEITEVPLKPTVIQKYCIPILESGENLLVRAPTGTGKTLAYLYPLIKGIKKKGDAQIVIIVPTRELAEQITNIGSKLIEGNKKFNNSNYNNKNFNNNKNYTFYSNFNNKNSNFNNNKNTINNKNSNFNNSKNNYTFNNNTININNNINNTKIIAVYGKLKSLSSYRGIDIIVATPGRLLDLLEKQLISLSSLSTLVLDEADELLRLGFYGTLLKIKGFISNSQTALFSATYDKSLQSAIDCFLGKSPTVVEIQNEVCCNIMHQFIHAETNKLSVLMQSLNATCELKSGWGQKSDKALVFVERREECRRVYQQLQKSGIPQMRVGMISGDVMQSERMETIGRFRKGLVNVLIATSVAARGIDIKDVKVVINYTMPKCIKEYIHRIGRTGREGKEGLAISLYDRKINIVMVRELIEVLKESNSKIPREFHEILNSNKKSNKKNKNEEVFVEKEEVLFVEKEDSIEDIAGGEW
ncbi:cshE [Nucleospora cyclopteri]